MSGRSFLHGDPQIASEDHLKARWSCGKPGERFRCAFCGYKFKLGDTWRCQYTNSTPGASGNPLVCVTCDLPPEQLIAKWKAMHEEHEARFWWFHRD